MCLSGFSRKKKCFPRNLVLTLRRDFVALKKHNDDDDRQRRGKDEEAHRRQNLSTRVKKHFMPFDRW